MQYILRTFGSRMSLVATKFLYQKNLVEYYNKMRLKVLKPNFCKQLLFATKYQFNSKVSSR